MLALFHEKYDTPPDLLACPSVCTEETQKPLALIALSEEEQVSAIVTKHAVSSYIKSLRQEKWNNETHNKLHHFQPLIGITPLTGVYCCQDETVLRWCRIGHTFYTHSYILYSFIHFKGRG